MAFSQVISVPFPSEEIQLLSQFPELVPQYFSNKKEKLFLTYKCQSRFLLLANKEEPAKEKEPDRTSERPEEN